MITIKYLKPIYIRFSHDKEHAINNDSYIIDIVEDDHMLMYKKDEITIEIARFKQLIDAIDYVKWLCEC